MSGGGRDERERQDAYNRAQTAATQINQVDPLEERYRQQQMAFLNWKDSNGRDVRDAPGLSDYIQIGQAAQERAGRERMGTGALQLAGDAGNAGNLRELKKQEAAQDFGTGLERAYAMRNAEATGSVMPLANMTLNRNTAYAGAMGNLYGIRSSQPKPKSWWNYLQEGAQMAGSIGGAISPWS